MESEGEIKRRAFGTLVRQKYGLEVGEWHPIQTAKKSLVFGQWLVIYDTGAIVVPSNDSKVTSWLRECKTELDAMSWNEILHLARELKQTEKTKVELHEEDGVFVGHNSKQIDDKKRKLAGLNSVLESVG